MTKVRKLKERNHTVKPMRTRSGGGKHQRKLDKFKGYSEVK